MAFRERKRAVGEEAWAPEIRGETLTVLAERSQQGQPGRCCLQNSEMGIIFLEMPENLHLRDFSWSHLQTHLVHLPKQSQFPRNCAKFRFHRLLQKKEGSFWRGHAACETSCCCSPWVLRASRGLRETGQVHGWEMHWQLEVHQTSHPAQEDPEMKTALSCVPHFPCSYTLPTHLLMDTIVISFPLKKHLTSFQKGAGKGRKMKKKEESESLQGKRYKQGTGEENGKVQCSVRASTGLLELAQVCSAL